MKGIGLGLHNYHDAHNCFPPAYLADADGKPMHSWRVLILPYIYRHAMDGYRFDEPWNSPHNLQFDTPEVRAHFACPSTPGYLNTPMTSYVAVTGSQTAFPETDSTSVTDIRDGLGVTVFVVEIADSGIHWMEPRDLAFDRMSFRVNDPERPSISSPHPRSANVLTGDGMVYRMPKTVSPATVRALLTAAGGEPIDSDDLFRDVICVRPDP